MLLLVAPAFARPASVDFVDSAEGHIRCHAEERGDLARCAEVVVWAEEAWAAQVDRIGFTAPLPDGDLGGSSALDIYLTREAGGAGSAWVDCDGGDPNCVDADPGDDRATATSYVVIDPRTDDAMFRSYVHHEFQHTTQYATDYTEPFLSLWESTAVACEHWTDPTWPTSAADLADYQATPWLSAVLQDGYFLADIGYSDDSWYEYGAVAWMFWMDATYGDGAGAVGPAIWAAAAEPGATVLDAWQVLSGDWQSSFLAFTAERARMGTDAGPAWAAFAGEQGYAARERVGGRNTPTSPEHAPYPLGVSYFHLVNGTFSVTFEGDPSTTWALLDVSDTDWQAVDADNPLVSGDTLAVINLGPPGFAATDPLEPADFTVTLGPAEEAAAPCGCAGGSGAAAWVGLGALAGLRGRRRGGLSSGDVAS